MEVIRQAEAASAVPILPNAEAKPGARAPVRVRLMVLIALAVLVRGSLAAGTSSLGTPIEDEQHYVTLASNLIDGHGFALSPGSPTSLRPPLYPAFIAAVWGASGSRSLQAVRWAQVAIGILSVVLLYSIGCHWFNERSAFLAASGLALYPSLLFSGVVLLSETLFTALLLLLVWAFARFERRPSPPLAFVTGLSLGLAALARSVMWPFIIILAPLMWVTGESATRRRIAAIAALMLGYLAVVAPWSMRNTSLQGTFTVVDTMGGLNLLMGNYAHTPEDRMWDAVSLRGEKGWSRTLPPAAPDGSRWTEGKKEKWAQREAIAFIVAHPLTTLRRSALKFADFWGLERDFIAGIQRGYYHPPLWLAVLGGATMTVAYVAVAILSVIGICLTPPRRSAHAFLLAVALIICGIHVVVFGHSRYHLPLIPLLLLYASVAVTSGEWRRVLSWRREAMLAVSIILLLCLIWSREIVFRDWHRIQSLVGSGV